MYNINVYKKVSRVWVLFCRYRYFKSHRYVPIPIHRPTSILDLVIKKKHWFIKRSQHVPTSTHISTSCVPYRVQFSLSWYNCNSSKLKRISNACKENIYITLTCNDFTFGINSFLIMHTNYIISVNLQTRFIFVSLVPNYT